MYFMTSLVLVILHASIYKNKVMCTCEVCLSTTYKLTKKIIDKNSGQLLKKS